MKAYTYVRGHIRRVARRRITRRTPNKTKLLKILRASRSAKIKKGWSRDIRAGFVKEDIKKVVVHPNKSFTLYLFDNPPYGHAQRFKASDLNLGETEELIKYLSKRKK